ncbi:hypothetical protein PLICRDRAFT_36186 [Plicaturopsis crispa FD-325 SS-3]|nr:hypothetical protein PLICRDRAFT_36186 [Plicaturopsis crispa FD-325 SS-3]
MFVIGSYILPTGSNWHEWSQIHPEDRLRDVVTFCTTNPEKPVLLMGDLNARIGSLTPRRCGLGRSSEDDGVPNTRGRWLLRMCNSARLAILNGTWLEDSSPGAFTSFQTNGCSVIDFAICSSRLLDACEWNSRGTRATATRTRMRS